jgi:anti-anti-sigma factor
MELTVSEDCSPGGHPILKVSGEIDVYTSEILRDTVLDWIERGRHRFAIDLTGVDFLDSTGLGVLVGGLKRCYRQGGWLALIIVDNEHVHKHFRITGLTKVFPILYSADELDAWDRSTKAERMEEVEFSGNWLPIRLYYQADADARVGGRLQYLNATFGIDYVHSFPVVREVDSWLLETIAHMRKSGTQPRSLAELEQVIEERLALSGWARWARWARHRQKRSTAVGSLIAALDGTLQAVVQIGSVVLVKTGAVARVRNLTEGELARYERDPALFKNPVDAMRFLQRAAAEDTEFTFENNGKPLHQRTTQRLSVDRPASTMPVTIYLSDEAVHEQVEAEVEALLAFAGLEIDDRDEPVIGSWYRRMQARLKAASTSASPLAREAAMTAAHAAEAKLVLGMDAEIAARFMENLGPLIVSLQPTKDAVIRLGAVLLLKVDWVVTVHQLTPAQQFKLDHDVAVPTTPLELIEAIRLKPQDPVALGPTTGARVDKASL